MSLTETARSTACHGSPVDRERARRTIPPIRGDADPNDPITDPSVWLDHVLYAEHCDPAALNRLVGEYDRYARSLASRMSRNREPREDLDQVALEALVVALQRFDPDRRLPFPSYATPTILGALRRHYRDRGWLLRVPRIVHELTTGARATSERLTIELGRTPSITEVARAMNVAVDDLLGAQEAAAARHTDSLDAQTDDGLSQLGRTGSVDRELALVEDRVALGVALESVDAQGQTLLRLYYFEGQTQSEIAASMGISQMQVSRLLARILRGLRNQMTAV